MIKKYIAAGLTLFMALVLVSPIFSLGNMTTPCCQQNDMNCCMQLDADDCPMEMNSGTNVIVLLLISGPKVTTNHSNDLTPVEQMYTGFNNLVSANIFTANIPILSAPHPTSFLTPLLI